ncbi:MAG: peptide-methionine (R)-S-oxide reductase MsrB [Gemmatimonadaceae bacterium]
MSVFENSFTRREFIVATAAAALLRRSPLAPVEVTIVQFSDKGERQGTIKVPKIVKTDAEWRKQLAPLAFEIARERGTERPFTGAYWNLHEKGLFRCICCDTPLFDSAVKFDSGTGWPSFWQPIAEENVHHGKPSPGDVESEVTCRRCDAHLGDLFSDGPKPTGLRYCIDSVALRFVKFV